jgi:hypothetical protein
MSADLVSDDKEKRKTNIDKNPVREGQGNDSIRADMDDSDSKKNYPQPSEDDEKFKNQDEFDSDVPNKSI